METDVRSIGSPSGAEIPAEVPMIREDVVREMLARLERGEGIKRIARELGVDRKTVKAWRRRGGWRPRVIGRRRRAVDAFAPFIEQRAPEVGWNSVVLHRELQGLGFTGGYLQVQRYLQPLRAARQWAALATTRFETGPGEQAQVDFGQLRVWVGDIEVTAHLFVFTLGYSRRLWARAYPHERLDVVLDGHERAFRHFGGVPLTCLYDNPRTQVLGRRERQVLWHPGFEDFARYYGFTPRACQPYRARTKGKVESGVKYVKRNALAGRRFASWEALNAWLEEWCLTVADQRVHGTTHERPAERFARETLTPLGARAAYQYEQRRQRRVPADALVAIAAGRYPVPVQYVGTTVTIAETATHYEISSGTTLIARHLKRPRFSVTMEPGHYAGLLRPSGAAARPPQADPAYRPLGAVEICDLAIYADLVEAEVGDEHPTARSAARGVSPPAALSDRSRAGRDPRARRQTRRELRRLPRRGARPRSRRQNSEAPGHAGGHGPLPFQKTLESFDFKFQPSIDAKLVRELASGRYVEGGDNILLLGPPGVGKTHLAVALGLKACEHGYRTLFTTAAGLIATLGKALAENRLDERLKLLAQPQVLIIDEIGYIPIDRQGANLLFQLVSRRYERGATIVTSNQSLGAWGDVFGDSVIAAAILDRLLHHSITVNIKGES